MTQKWVSIFGVGRNLTGALLNQDVLGNTPKSLEASCLEVSNMTSKTATGFFNLPLPYHAARLPIYPHSPSPLEFPRGSRVDRSLTTILIQEPRLLRRTLKRPLLDIDARILRLLHQCPVVERCERIVRYTRIWTRMPHRFLAIVIHLQTQLTAPAQTSNPSDSSEGSGAVLLGKKILSVIERSFRG